MNVNKTKVVWFLRFLGVIFVAVVGLSFLKQCSSDPAEATTESVVTTAEVEQESVECNEANVIDEIIKTTRKGMGETERDFWRKSITLTAQKEKFSPVLWAGVVAVESKFRGHLISNKGAKGASQVMPMWLNEHPEHCKGVDLLEIEQNLTCGAKILADYIRECKGITAGLRCYNAGPQGQRNVQGYANDVQTIAALATIKVCKPVMGLADNS